MIAELSASANGQSYEAGSSSTDILQLEVADPRLLRLAQAQVSTTVNTLQSFTAFFEYWTDC
jgi:hypothetical protein